MRKYFFFVLKLFIIFPVLLIIKLIKPWKIVRIGLIPSNAYGGMLIAPEIYLCHIDKHGRGKNFDIFYFNDFNNTIVNTFLASKQKRLLRVWPIAKVIDRFNRSYLGWKDHEINLVQDFFADTEGLLKEYPCHVTFTKEEHQQGEALLVELGIPLDKPLVCFFNRDAKFVLETFGAISKTELNQSYRNTDIDDYLPAAEYLAEQGYFVVRMGKCNYEPVKTSSSNILDYVFSSKRSDFLDLYIFSRCLFAFGCATGISFCATLFRKPMAYANMAPFFAKYIRNPDYYDLYLPNKYFLIDQNRLATLDEIIKIQLDDPLRVHFDSGTQKWGIKYLKNSPEDVKALVQQMKDNISNGFYKSIQSSYKDSFMKKVDNILPQGRLREASIPEFYLRSLN